MFPLEQEFGLEELPHLKERSLSGDMYANPQLLVSVIIL